MKFAALFLVLFSSISAYAWECEAWVWVNSDSGISILNVREPMTDVLGDQSNYSSTYKKDGVVVRLNVQRESGRVTVTIHNKNNLLLNNTSNVGQFSTQQQMVAYDTRANGHGIKANAGISCL